ncbi:MAG: hypothetical protein KBS85_08245 [Lachnospiraceae bacterium]|nr:hypothetical protein [Candidatus Merdinaster equi]
MKKMGRIVALLLMAFAVVIGFSALSLKSEAAGYVKVETKMQCSVWSAPNTAEGNRVKVIPAGYTVSIDNTKVYNSTANDGKIFYKTSKGCYILCKCFFENGVIPSSGTAVKPSTPVKEEKKQTQTDGKIIEVNSSNFKSVVLDSDIPVFIEVGGDWCMWCVRFMPVLEEAAQNYRNIKFVHITYDSSHRDLSFVENYIPRSITGFPGDLVFKDGKCTTQTSGYMNEDNFEKFIKNSILN